ncbi:unnamed protein product [Acanthoscelides obtectus]|uniref:Fibrinogen C-terminal domain-containing protein n=1 Tax=Acanthoscelides obtectus TaxID=200917 RepID=A0A9P0NVK2_ACAOB|nr:unnamed protein product [Acanthoscelides obtectus]CAK1661858.1 Ficolin-2 [Acanthoscelides obtectus]
MCPGFQHSVTRKRLSNKSKMKSAAFFEVAILVTFFVYAAYAGTRNYSTLSQQVFFKSCMDAKLKGIHSSGLYTIQPDYAHEPFLVFCEMEVDGGGWTVIQNRFDGSIKFYQDWPTYKAGFGNLRGEFWLGLDRIHEITGIFVNELRVELEDFENETRFAKYSVFSIGSEAEYFSLKALGGYSGTAGDSLEYQAGQKFSTYDQDHDNSENNCAVTFTGAWWYNACHRSNLNGNYLRGESNESGMVWTKFRGIKYSLKTSRMMVRPSSEGIDSTMAVDAS